MCVCVCVYVCVCGCVRASCVHVSVVHAHKHIDTVTAVALSNAASLLYTVMCFAQGQIITDNDHIKQRWGGYFEELLNPNEATRDNNFLAHNILEH